MIWNGGIGLQAYVTFDLVLKSTNLWVAPYSEYQEFLHQTISDMREKDFTFHEIADWLNDNGYKTPRGKKFRSPHAHSIIKKKKIRDERLGRDYPAVLENFDILFI